MENRENRTPEEMKAETMELLKTMKTDPSEFSGREFVGKVTGIRARKQVWKDGTSDVMITLFLETDYTEKLVPISYKYSEHPNSNYAKFLKALGSVGAKIDSIADLDGQTFRWKENYLSYLIEGEQKQSILTLPLEWIRKTEEKK